MSVSLVDVLMSINAVLTGRLDRSPEGLGAAPEKRRLLDFWF